MYAFTGIRNLSKLVQIFNLPWTAILANENCDSENAKAPWAWNVHGYGGL